MRLEQAVMIGCGGTGSHLLEPMTRLLLHHPDSEVDRLMPGLTLVDGDRFDAGNAARQLGAYAGAWKADVALDRVVRLLPNAVSVPRYLDRYLFKDLILGSLGSTEQALLLVLAVDNHATRRDCLLELGESRWGTFLCLSPGNDLAIGQVHVWARVDGKDVTSSPLACDPDGHPAHPEIHHPRDRIPGGGCLEEQAATPQLIVANALAAAGCLLAVQAWLDDEKIPDEVVFDARDFKLMPSGGLVALPLQPDEVNEDEDEVDLPDPDAPDDAVDQGATGGHVTIVGGTFWGDWGPTTQWRRAEVPPVAPAPPAEPVPPDAPAEVQAAEIRAEAIAPAPADDPAF